MNLSLAADIIGLFGTTLVVLGYYLLQLEKIHARSLSYNLINLTGAILLLLSLLVHFNLASIVIEIFWIGASLIGLYKISQRRHHKKNDPHSN